MHGDGYLCKIGAHFHNAISTSDISASPKIDDSEMYIVDVTF